MDLCHLGVQFACLLFRLIWLVNRLCLLLLHSWVQPQCLRLPGVPSKPSQANWEKSISAWKLCNGTNRHWWGSRTSSWYRTYWRNWVCAIPGSTAWRCEEEDADCWICWSGRIRSLRRFKSVLPRNARFDIFFLASHRNRGKLNTTSYSKPLLWFNWYNGDNLLIRICAVSGSRYTKRSWDHWQNSLNQKVTVEFLWNISW